MRQGCTVTVAASVMAGISAAGLGLTPTVVQAACDSGNPAACALAAQAVAAGPLQLNRFMAPAPSRRSALPSGVNGAPRKPVARAAAVPAPRPRPNVMAAKSTPADAPLTPNAIPTISISAPARAPAPAAEDRTVGFASGVEPWTGGGPFTRTDEPHTLPPGVRLARADEVNEIDLAADTASNTVRRAIRSDGAGVSLITPANAGTPSESSTAHAKPETSWLSSALTWAYAKFVDGILAVFLAIRSLFA